MIWDLFLIKYGFVYLQNNTNKKTLHKIWFLSFCVTFLCQRTKLDYSVKAANDASGIKQAKANTDLSMFFHY